MHQQLLVAFSNPFLTHSRTLYSRFHACLLAAQDYIDSALTTALQIHQDADEGDILVFLPGQEEITDLAALLKRHLEQDKTLKDSLLSTTGGTDIVQSLKGMGTNVSAQAGMIVNGVMICVLYAALPSEAQMVAFAPKPPGCSRKIILSTNIAETSGTCNRKWKAFSTIALVLCH